MDTFHLFPPVDKVLADSLAADLRREAVKVCSHLLENLVSSLPLSDGKILEPARAGPSDDEGRAGTCMYVCSV